MFERFTTGARGVVIRAQQEAKGLGHNYIGTEHLLLGLLGVAGPAQRALDRLGVSLDDARSDVVRIVGVGFTIGDGPTSGRRMPKRSGRSGSTSKKSAAE